MGAKTKSTAFGLVSLFWSGCVQTPVAANLTTGTSAVRAVATASSTEVATATATATDTAPSTATATGTATATAAAVAPSVPVFAAAQPGAFGFGLSFLAKGTADDGSTVQFYATSDCSGAPLAHASAAAFATGVAVVAPDFGRISLYAAATSKDGLTSGCSATPQVYTAVAWTWSGGIAQGPFAGSYGVQGVADPSNLPTPRGGGALTTVTKAGKSQLWAFGGNTDPNYGDLDDLWRFDVLSGQWTWLSGNQGASSQAGTFGVLGVEAASNLPPNRAALQIWKGTDGNLYIFSGFHQGSLTDWAHVTDTSDVWRLNTVDHNWTWVAGGFSQVTAYGSLGVPAPSNQPPARASAATWTDADGNLWMFSGTNGANDLWRLNTTTFVWTWMGGSAAANQNGTYGQKGVTATTNWPGSRNTSCTVTDANGLVWMFGGVGYDASGNGGGLNDLWTWSPVASQWTWLAGDTTANSLGSYGTLGMPSAGNAPASRRSAACWSDSAGRFWLFGGQAFDSMGNIPGQLNDLWVYDPGTAAWTWVGGAASTGAFGIYEQKGVASVTATPGARQDIQFAAIPELHAVAIFGGSGLAGSGSATNLNDTWLLPVP